MPRQVPQETFHSHLRVQHATWPLLTARIHGAVFFAGAGGKGSLEVPQLSADVHLQQHCVQKGKGVCVVGLLDLGRPG